MSLRNVEVSKSLDLNKKSRQCDISNSMSRERMAYSWIVEKIGCNLPWSNFKIGKHSIFEAFLDQYLTTTLNQNSWSEQL